MVLPLTSLPENLPEAQLNLAQAVIHLATAPKSNSALVAITQARSDVKKGVGRRVPVHLRDGHYSGAQDLGHGAGYVYPHGNEEGWVDQQYLPDEITHERYYSPTRHGHEAELSGLQHRWRVVNSSTENTGDSGSDDQGDNK